MDPYVEKGSVCDQNAGTEGCILKPDQRQRAVLALISLIGLANSSYLTALQSEELEAVLQKESMGIAGEVALGALSTVLGFGIEGAALMLATRVLGQAAWDGTIVASRIPELAAAGARKLSAAVSPVLGTVRARTIAAFSGISAETGRKVNFLESLKGSASAFWSDMNNRIESGTDIELLAAVQMLDPQVVNYKSFRNAIADLCTRLQQQHFEQVDKGWIKGQDAGRAVVMRLTAYGRTSLAFVRMNNRVIFKTSGHGGDTYDIPEDHRFVRWIDNDFEEAAREAMDKKGMSIEDVDVSDPSTLPFRDSNIGDVERFARLAKEQRSRP